MNDPLYEIWGGWDDDQDYGAEAEHLEDCFTLSEAMEAVREWRQSQFRYAFVKNKETGETVEEYSDGRL